MTSKGKILILSILLGSLSACDGQRKEPAAGAAESGREETRNLRNVEAIGYGGEKIANQVDAALDANDQRSRQLDEAGDY